MKKKVFFDKDRLALFRRYESNVKGEFSEKDMMAITDEALIYDFLITVKDRLPDVLERDKRGEYENGPGISQPVHLSLRLKL